MIKKEALKLALDGKKVRNKLWPAGTYLVWIKRGFFVTANGSEFFATFSSDWLENPGEWEEFPETVDFTTAFKAHEEGKIMKSTLSGLCYSQKGESISDREIRGEISRAEIRGQWIILN